MTNLFKQPFSGFDFLSFYICFLCLYSFLKIVFLFWNNFRFTRIVEFSFNIKGNWLSNFLYNHVKFVKTKTLTLTTLLLNCRLYSDFTSVYKCIFPLPWYNPGYHTAFSDLFLKYNFDCLLKTGYRRTGRSWTTSRELLLTLVVD